MREAHPARSLAARSGPRRRADWPPPGRALTEGDAEAYVHGICFKTGPPRRIGVELEWLVQDVSDPLLPADQPRLAAALAAATEDGVLPRGAALTREPGGQVELSSLPAESLPQCVADVGADLHALRTALAHHGFRLAGYGHDPWRAPVRVLDQPRYAAMEQFFDRLGTSGRAMMGASASVQVCVDAGTEEPGTHGYVRRWRLAHLLGPVLVAAFANSPLQQGRPSGWRSTRQAIWARMDPCRTLAPPGPDADPRGAWAGYALDASLLCVRRGDGRPWTAPPGLTFRQWIRQSAAPPGSPGPEAPERPPTTEDLAYHLTTLFPPVRPQGHLELRMIDAQPGDDGWIVPLAVVTALFDDPVATGVAEDVAGRLAVPGETGPRNPLWVRAARFGLTDPELREAARACFAAAAAALPRLGATDAIRDAVAGFTERYVARGRSPADDLLDAVHPAAPGPATGSSAAPTAVRPDSAPTSPAPGTETPRC
jgi:glutamate--cysteine ligase